jgi:hypothetical protein
MCPMERRVALDLRGTARLGGYLDGAPFEVLISGVEAAWIASDPNEVAISAAWDDDPDWDAMLQAAGWQLEVPRRHRTLGITTSHGPLRAHGEVRDRSGLRRFLAAANADEMPFGPFEMSVVLAAPDGSVNWTLTLYRDVLEVVLQGDDRNNTFAAVTSALHRAAGRVDLRLTERA